MNIVVLESSPHKKGSSNLLAEQFIRGAEEAGHKVSALDIAHMNIQPCLGCSDCVEIHNCVLKDDMEIVREEMLQADMIVFVTPTYFYGITAPLKTVIDRCHSFYHAFRQRKPRTALIVTQARPDLEGMYFIRDYYQALCEYIGYSNVGMVLGNNCMTPEATRTTPHMQQAYMLGKTCDQM